MTDDFRLAQEQFERAQALATELSQVRQQLEKANQLIAALESDLGQFRNHAHTLKLDLEAAEEDAAKLYETGMLVDRYRWRIGDVGDVIAAHGEFKDALIAHSTRIGKRG